MHGSFRLNNGKQIRFWEDKLLGNYSLKDQYPSLYNIARRKSVTVESVLSTVPLNVSFHRFHNQNNIVLWNDLVSRIMHVRLNAQADVFIWNLHQNGQYMVKSLYMALISNGVAHMNKQLWKLKVPLKIKIFMWYMRKEVVITKDNLARQNWGGSTQCSFCLRDVSIQHLFFDCLYARFLWGLVQITFSISPPQNIQHLFTGWINQGRGKLKQQLLVGTLACWAIWLSRNPIIFDKALIKSFMQVLYRGHIGFAFGHSSKVMSKTRR
jgi:hypothetical protein